MRTTSARSSKAKSARSEKAVLAAARSDPDNPPLEDRRPGSLGKPRVRAFVIRRALGLSQEEFAKRFGIPIGLLRDWEHGHVEPDRAARSYLKVIAKNPKAVAQALEPA